MIGLALTLLGALVVVGALQIQDPTEAGGLRSYTFPLLIGILLLVTGLNLAVVSWRSTDGSQVDWPDRAGFSRMGVVAASLALFILVMELVGFVIGAALLMAFQVWYLGRDRWYIPASAGLVTGAVIYIIFVKVLGLSLPTGPLN